MTRTAKYTLIIPALILTLAGGLFLVDEFVPREVEFGTEDIEARRYYEELVKKHGFEFHYAKNVHGETYVVIESINLNEALEIRCEYRGWDAARSRKKGITVFESEECLK